MSAAHREDFELVQEWMGLGQVQVPETCSVLMVLSSPSIAVTSEADEWVKEVFPYSLT